jgi:hypothetical protein
MNSSSVIIQFCIFVVVFCILVVLVNFTRSPVTIISVQEAEEIVQIEQLDREVRALKKKVGLQ